MTHIRVNTPTSPETRIPVQHGNAVIMDHNEITLREAEPGIDMAQALHRFSDEAATTLPEPAPTPPERPSHARYLARISGFGGAVAVAALLAFNTDKVAPAYDSVRASLGVDPGKLAEQDAKRDAELRVQQGQKIKHIKETDSKYVNSFVVGTEESSKK